MRFFGKKASNTAYTEDDRNETLEILENNFGKCIQLLHEVVSDDIHIDIAVIGPTKELDFYKVFTIGMASKEMNVPSEFKHQKLERAELAMFISKDMDINIADIKNHWVINCLKTVAHMPFQQNTWVGEAHSIDLSNSDNYGGFSGVLLLSLQSGKDAIVLDSNKRLNFYLTVPIFKEEMNYENQNGFNDLLDLFDNNGIEPIVDFNRINCCL